MCAIPADLKRSRVYVNNALQEVFTGPKVIITNYPPVNYPNTV